ncbi:MAG TPA: hypothetical protein EYG38_05010 [Verrucomicrobia bacterium]|nr:hypothetical protein [Verrucomicrobiota bacterium]
MKNKIDIKSVAIGVSLTATSIFGVAAVTDEADQIGRYQIGITDSYVIILDSNSGDMWRTYPSSIHDIKHFKTR